MSKSEESMSAEERRRHLEAWFAGVIAEADGRIVDFESVLRYFLHDWGELREELLSRAQDQEEEERQLGEERSCEDRSA